jgi:predicted dehydrogenase
MPEHTPLRLAVAGLSPDERPLARLVLADRRLDDAGAGGLDAALADPAVEAVWLGAAADPGDPLRVVAAGRALLLSAPPAAGLDALDELAGAARAAGVAVAVRHRRASPPFARAAALVADGRAGLPRAVHVHLIEAAGGAPAERLLFEGIDAVRAIVGLDPVAVHATGPAASAGAGATVAVVELERDVPATFVVGRSPDADPVAAGLRRIVLVGSQAMLALEEDRPRLEVRGGAGARAGDGGAARAVAGALAAELVGIVRDGRPPVCGLDDARVALAVVLAAGEAAGARALVGLGAAA